MDGCSSTKLIKDNAAKVVRTATSVLNAKILLEMGLYFIVLSNSSDNMDIKKQNLALTVRR